MKAKTVFFCTECGYDSPKWIGKCPACGEWNTLKEQKVFGDNTSFSKVGEEIKPVLVSQISADERGRISTGIKELDSVLGGGLVKGSLVLVGGEPGIGKSTLLMEACLGLGKVLYITGEESGQQLKMRADRLGANSDNLYILPETDIDNAIEWVDKLNPDACIVDSVQTMFTESASGAGGSISQVREVTLKIMHTAKRTGTAFFIVGHVTKDGNIAGPRLLEHMVDCVLYFEGERNQNYRILRAVKNRFGSTNEISIFEMTEKGLFGVENPSAALLSGRPSKSSGSSVTCLLEGTRPILAEIQALVSPTGFGIPRRAADGMDYTRLSLLIAIIEKKLGLNLQNQDVYVNVVGGLKVSETSADLSVICAIISSLKNKTLASDTVFLGEAGLAGEIRSINSASRRIGEALKLGFKKCVIPYANLKGTEEFTGIEIIPVNTIMDVLKADIYEDR